LSKPRKKRKTKRALGRKSYRKGKEFEKKVYSFLRREGFKVHKTRLRFRKGEFDGLATDKHGRTYGIEAKNTKQKVSATIVRNLKKKVDRNKPLGLVKGVIVVSRKGFTQKAEQEAERACGAIKTFKYKQKRKTSDWF